MHFTATNGVVVAAEKKMPNTLIDETTVEKSALLSENVGVVYAGLAPDFRVLVAKGAAGSVPRLVSDGSGVVLRPQEGTPILSDVQRADPRVTDCRRDGLDYAGVYPIRVGVDCVLLAA